MLQYSNALIREILCAPEFIVDLGRKKEDILEELASKLRPEVERILQREGLGID